MNVYDKLGLFEDLNPVKNEGVVMGSEFKPRLITYNVFMKY